MLALDNFINNVKTLPPAPRVLLQLLPLLGELDVDSSQVVELVKFDPALTAKVLQCCNNAVTGRGEPVTDLHQAVVRLGFNEIYRLTAAVVSEAALSAEQRGYGFASGQLWQHSAVTAIAGRIIARELGGDENLVFTAALLHDIGKLVLGASLENAYEVVVNRIAGSGQSFVEAEKAILGVEHAEVGGRVLQRWNFPDSLVRAVWHHHEPLLAKPFELLSGCVYLADMVSHMLGHGLGHQAFAIRGRGEVMELLEITAGNLDRFVIHTNEALENASWLTLTSP
jgi:putative nucleotidyltransferase with HDIG domain